MGGVWKRSNVWSKAVPIDRGLELNKTYRHRPKARALGRAMTTKVKVTVTDPRERLPKMLVEVAEVTNKLGTE